MLALAPLRNCNDERKGAEEMESFSIGDDDFTAGNLLDDIDFDDLFVGMDYGDVLPDLEIDPEMLGEFSVSGGEESEFNNVSSTTSTENKLVNHHQDHQNGSRREEEDTGSGSGSGSGSCLSREDEIVSKRDESSKISNNNNPSNKESSRSRKSGSQTNKGSQGGKRKVKVDWTPELHRRFVQAVEQLGMDKAVPSRILEIMGIDCLTRHNIASHLQKYRSHQKHLLAREAEAASWSQRRQIYGGGGAAAAAAAARGNKMSRSDHHQQHLNPWMMNAPTMGFPPPPAAAAAAAAAAAPNLLHPYRPLHVWGHPTVDHSSMHVWPKHLLHHHSPSPPPPLPPPHHHHHHHHHPRWPPLPSSPSDPSSYWHPNPHPHQRVPNGLTPAGTPGFPHHQQLAITRISSSAPPIVPGIPPPPPLPPHAMYKVDHGIGGGVLPPPISGHSDSHPPPPFDLLHPTKERIDAAIGDVLSKPWLPLPLGLKPPALDSVLVELQRQGIPKIPPSAGTATATATATSSSTTPADTVA